MIPYCVRNSEGEFPPCPFRGVVDLKDLLHVIPKSLPLVYHSITEITQPVPKSRSAPSLLTSDLGINWEKNERGREGIKETRS